MDLSTIISLVSGAVGGNLAGLGMPEKNMGPIVNTIAGLVGGGLGEFIIKAFGIVTAATAAGSGVTGGSEMDLTQLLSSVGIGGALGAVITAIVAFIKDAMQKKAG